MTREIKFRGMDIKGNWYYGNLSILTGKINHVEAGTYISNSVGLPFAYQIRPETVGQYTGLKDKNGTEIYEGDWVKQTLKEVPLNFPDRVIDVEYEGIVVWYGRPPSFRIEVKMKNWEGQRVAQGFHSEFVNEYKQEYEVIGNIYENPKLLKEPTP